MAPRKLPRTKFNPYYILVLLVWGDHVGVRRLGGRAVELETGPVSRSLRVTPGRLREYVGYLAECGLVEILEDGWGSLSLRVTEPFPT